MSETILVSSIIALMVAAGYTAVKVMRLPFRSLVLGISGAIVGLLLGALLSLPLGNLPSPFGTILPLVISLLITVVMIGAFVNQSEQLAQLVPFLRPLADSLESTSTSATKQILVDTSVIIDGRIADIALAGFVPGKLLVPRFVLAELQNIADSDEPMRRGRGRRGLEMLNSIRNTAGIEIEIIEDDMPQITEVDAKLVGLAKIKKADILTTDYNLNRVAQIEGVRVLNINELSNAIRPVVLPGEEMTVKIVQAGKERNQGVGYLSDGTMIVVDNGDKLIGQEVATEVTRVFQTVAGKMIFATPLKSTRVPKSANKHSASTGESGGSTPPIDVVGQPSDTASQRHNSSQTPNRFRPRPQQSARRPVSTSQLEDSLVRQNSKQREEG